MTSDSIDKNALQPDAAADECLFDSWFDPIEHAVRDRVRSFIEELIESELATVLARPRYGRRAPEADGTAGAAGHRHGSRKRTLTGPFGKSEITVPRARLPTLHVQASCRSSPSTARHRRRRPSARALRSSHPRRTAPCTHAPAAP